MKAPELVVAGSSRPVLRLANGRLAPGSGKPPKLRGRVGAQPGNLNASRRPWVTFWRRRALKPEDRWALALVEGYVDQLVADKGGPEHVSSAERRVMELAAVSRCCWALALAGGDPHAVARFVNSERASLEAVGLERRAKPGRGLEEILAASRVNGSNGGSQA